jgi:hypothetical protein
MPDIVARVARKEADCAVYTILRSWEDVISGNVTKPCSTIANMGRRGGFPFRVRGVSGLGVAFLASGTAGLMLVIAAALLMSVGCQKSSDAARWLARSRNYKSEVLAQPTAVGELKHIEWDGWGWGGQDTTVYLVYDPADSLAAAAKGQKPGKFNGIPCEVLRVRRLESYWYTVQFYTNEFWGRSNALNCTGARTES